MGKNYEFSSESVTELIYFVFFRDRHSTKGDGMSRGRTSDIPTAIYASLGLFALRPLILLTLFQKKSHFPQFLRMIPYYQATL